MIERIPEVRWGFIGCGAATEKKSGPAFNIPEGSRTVAVMSRTRDKVRDYAERHKIKHWYTDAQQLIDDPLVNAVYIATPPSTHATYAIMALKSGKPVYVEKPLSANYEDCGRINRLSAKTGIPCFVAYYRRFLPYFQKVKELLADGAIGHPLNVQLRFAQPAQAMDYNRDNLPWRVQPDIAGGGYFYDIAPHQIDILQWLFGEIVEAKGYRSNLASLYETEDTLSACFRFRSDRPGVGLVGSGSWCFVAGEEAKADRICVIGERGMLTFSVYTYQPIILTLHGGCKEFAVPNPPHVQLALIEQIVAHIQQKSICTMDSLHATSVNWVVDRILGKL